MNEETIRCLVVEDNPRLNRDLVFFLQSQGIEAAGVSDGEQMDHHLEGHACDVIVLDLGLPGEDGLSIANRIARRREISLVILTARDRLEDRIAGWESGAHVYLVKPTPLEEIAAVVNALYRKRHPVAESTGRNWTLRVDRRELLAPDGCAIPLTHRERLLLTALSESPNQKISRDLKLEQDGGGAIDSLIHRLRRKLKLHGDPIRTVYGEGFTFDETIICEGKTADTP